MRVRDNLQGNGVDDVVNGIVEQYTVKSDTTIKSGNFVDITTQSGGGGTGIDIPKTSKTITKYNNHMGGGITEVTISATPESLPVVYDDIKYLTQVKMFPYSNTERSRGIIFYSLANAVQYASLTAIACCEYINNGTGSVSLGSKGVKIVSTGYNSSTMSVTYSHGFYPSYNNSTNRHYYFAHSYETSASLNRIGAYAITHTFTAGSTSAGTVTNLGGYGGHYYASSTRPSYCDIDTREISGVILFLPKFVSGVMRAYIDFFCTSDTGYIVDKSEELTLTVDGTPYYFIPTYNLNFNSTNEYIITLAKPNTSDITTNEIYIRPIKMELTTTSYNAIAQSVYKLPEILESNENMYDISSPTIQMIYLGNDRYMVIRALKCAIYLDIFSSDGQSVTFETTTVIRSVIQTGMYSSTGAMNAHIALTRMDTSKVVMSIYDSHVYEGTDISFIYSIDASTIGETPKFTIYRSDYSIQGANILSLSTTQILLYSNQKIFKKHTIPQPVVNSNIYTQEVDSGYVTPYEKCYPAIYDGYAQYVKHLTVDGTDIVLMKPSQDTVAVTYIPIMENGEYKFKQNKTLTNADSYVYGTSGYTTHSSLGNMYFQLQIPSVALVRMHYSAVYSGVISYTVPSTASCYLMTNLYPSCIAKGDHIYIPTRFATGNMHLVNITIWSNTSITLNKEWGYGYDHTYATVVDTDSELYVFVVNTDKLVAGNFIINDNASISSIDFITIGTSMSNSFSDKLYSCKCRDGVAAVLRGANTDYGLSLGIYFFKKDTTILQTSLNIYDEFPNLNFNDFGMFRLKDDLLLIMFINSDDNNYLYSFIWDSNPSNNLSIIKSEYYILSKTPTVNSDSFNCIPVQDVEDTYIITYNEQPTGENIRTIACPITVKTIPNQPTVIVSPSTGEAFDGIARTSGNGGDIIDVVLPSISE